MPSLLFQPVPNLTGAELSCTHEPHIIEDVNTCNEGVFNELHNIACLNDNEVLTCGDQG